MSTLLGKTWVLPPKPTTQKETVAYYSYMLSVYGTPVIFIIAFITFGIAAAIVRDSAFPREHPVRFVVETLALGFISTLPFMYVIYSRTGTITAGNFLEFVILVLHFAGLHILFQYSGVYTLLFRGSKNNSTQPAYGGKQPVHRVPAGDAHK